MQHVASEKHRCNPNMDFWHLQEVLLCRLEEGHECCSPVAPKVTDSEESMGSWHALWMPVPWRVGLPGLVKLPVDVTILL